MELKLEDDNDYYKYIIKNGLQNDDDGYGIRDIEMIRYKRIVYAFCCGDVIKDTKLEKCPKCGYYLCWRNSAENDFEIYAYAYLYNHRKKLETKARIKREKLEKRENTNKSDLRKMNSGRRSNHEIFVQKILEERRRLGLY